MDPPSAQSESTGPAAGRGGPATNGSGPNAALAVSGAGTVLFLAWVALSSRGLGINGEWVWGRVSEPSLHALNLPLILSGMLLLLLWWVAIRGREPARRGIILALGGAVLLGLVLQFGLGSLGRAGSLETLFATMPRPNSYFHRAKNIESVREYLEHAEEELDSGRAPGQFRVQLSTHPPGSILFYYGLIRVAEQWPAGSDVVRDVAREFAPVEDAYEVPEIRRVLGVIGTPDQEAAAWMASFLLRLIASLVVIPVYLLCRHELPPRAAFSAALVSGLIPSIYLFSPHTDQIFPVVACTFFWLLAEGLRRGSGWWGLGAGCVLFLGFFFSLSFLVPAAAGACAWGLVLWRCRDRRTLTVGAGVLSGLLLSVAILWLTYGINMLGVWRACVAGNDYFNAISQRTWWKWFLFNPLELAVFAGVPLFMLFWWSWAAQVGRWVRGRGATDRGRTDGAGDTDCDASLRGAQGAERLRLSDLLVSLGIVLILLNLSGKNLGEVGRLWMIVMPLMLASAAETWMQWGSRLMAFPLAFGALQLVQVIGLRLTLDALGIYFS